VTNFVTAYSYDTVAYSEVTEKKAEELQALDCRPAAYVTFLNATESTLLD
jgi:hypothetical protein